MCDGNPLIPLGEYLLNIGKFIETLLTHNASPEQADAFIQSGAADKLLSLLFVRQIPIELSQSVFPQLVTNIMRFLFVSIFSIFYVQLSNKFLSSEGSCLIGLLIFNVAQGID